MWKQEEKLQGERAMSSFSLGRRLLRSVFTFVMDGGVVEVYCLRKALLAAMKQVESQALLRCITNGCNLAVPGKELSRKPNRRGKESLLGWYPITIAEKFSSWSQK